MRTVAVLGGGVAGLSAAHELAERGFEVTVYERKPTSAARPAACRSPGTGTGGRKDLPGEHGFRFFPGFYQHVTDTMRRIPFGDDGGSCADNLVQATRILLARAGKLDPLWVAAVPRNARRFPDRASWRCSTTSTSRTTRFAFFVTRLLGSRRAARSATSRSSSHPLLGFHRRAQPVGELPAIPGQGMTRSLVAMRAEESSTRTVGRILLQLFYGILVPGGVFDRLLTGPTNDVWMDPWRGT